MALTFDSIATVTVSSATNTVTFSSIPQTYTDLRIYCAAISSTGNTWFRYNNDSTANNYITGEIFSDSSPAASVATNAFTGLWNGYITQWDQTAQTHSIIDIFHYTNTSKYKNSLLQAGEGRTSFSGRAICLTAGTWQSSSAINTISFHAGASGNWSVGSVFALYGIKAA